MSLVVCGGAVALAVGAIDETTEGGCKFVYRRASPSVRWPHLQNQNLDEDVAVVDKRAVVAGNSDIGRIKVVEDSSADRSWRQKVPPKSTLVQRAVGRKEFSRISRLALKRAKDWRERVQRLSDAICSLGEKEFVVDIVNKWEEQLTATDLSYVLKQVAESDWQRALELYECLNVKRWYHPNPRMLAVMISVLGRANQASIAKELFDRAESIGKSVQVYNAIMGVYAKAGDWRKIQHIMMEMQERGCPVDLVTLNTVIKARTRDGMQDGLAASLLHEVYAAGLIPDVITYNTLISACSQNQRLKDAIQIFEEMRIQRCPPTLWTYNAMMNVYGKSGSVEAVMNIFMTLQEKGFKPDAITYNSMLHAFAKAGRVDDVDRIRKLMRQERCKADEITYNTIIHMYGKMGMHRKAEEMYIQMKEDGQFPDAVTFTALIDMFGKDGLVEEAASTFADMLNSEIKPTLQAYSAMICAFSKAGKYEDAEKTYRCMIGSGIQPDILISSVLLNLFYKGEMLEKCISIFEGMMVAGLKPELNDYSIMVRVYCKKDMEQEIENLTKDMLRSDLSPSGLSSALAKAGFYIEAAILLKATLSQGLSVGERTMDDVLLGLVSSEKYADLKTLVRIGCHFQPRVAARFQSKLIVMLANADRLEDAEEELERLKSSNQRPEAEVFKALLACYERAGMHNETTVMLQKMKNVGVRLDLGCYQCGVTAYCRLGMPTVASNLLNECVRTLGPLKDSAMHVSVIESFGIQKLWKDAEAMFEQLLQSDISVSFAAYNSLLLAYAECGQYEKAKSVLQQMAASEIKTEATTWNYVLQALGNAGRASEMGDFYQSMLQSGVAPNHRTFMIIFNAFAKERRLEDAKSMYQEMKRSGYPSDFEVLKIMLVIFSREECPSDAEELLIEMNKAGFEADIEIYNSMITLYCKVGRYREAIAVFKGMQARGCSPDTATYNALITLYCRHSMVQEAHALLKEMTKTTSIPDIFSYTSLISAYGRVQEWEEAEAVFNSMLEGGCKPDVTVFIVMINVYRKAGKHQQVEDIIKQMKSFGVEPSQTTMHMMLDSYGRGGHPDKAAEVFEKFESEGMHADVIDYTTLIDAYLKSEDYSTAIEWLMKMHSCGTTPTYMTVSCIIAAAAMCKTSSQMLTLLGALKDVGFPLPLRLMTEEKEQVLADTQQTFEKLQASGAHGGGVVNVILDLLWAFRKCATAAHIFVLAVQNNIYSRKVMRVRNMDWGADFRGLSPGAALVALMLWFDEMQDASLEGIPEVSKVVELVIGSSKLNNLTSVSRSIKLQLWQMASPFRASKTREGVMGAKGHALKMWLKESPYCFNLELKDCSELPEFNPIQNFEGALILETLVPAVTEIMDRMGNIRPKKFARLVHLPPETRTSVITAELKGRAEKLAKLHTVKVPGRDTRYPRRKKKGRR